MLNHHNNREARVTDLDQQIDAWEDLAWELADQADITVTACDPTDTVDRCVAALQTARDAHACLIGEDGYGVLHAEDLALEIEAALWIEPNGSWARDTADWWPVG